MREHLHQDFTNVLALGTDLYYRLEPTRLPDCHCPKSKCISPLCLMEGHLDLSLQVFGGSRTMSRDNWKIYKMTNKKDKSQLLDFEKAKQARRREWKHIVHLVVDLHTRSIYGLKLKTSNSTWMKFFERTRRKTTEKKLKALEAFESFRKELSLQSTILVERSTLQTFRSASPFQ